MLALILSARFRIPRRCSKYSGCWLIVRCAALIVGLIVANNVAAQQQPGDQVSYLQLLINESKQKNLAKHPSWLALLRYRPQSFHQSRFESVIDDPSYFLAEDGKHNPESELIATLEAFFREALADDAHPQCRFRGRFTWLAQQLAFDFELLPQASCHRFQQWKEALAPEAITLVYPSSYLNNPASMFGHTLLRIDAKGQSEATRMLAYAANYGAMTDETSGVAFAINGLFGGYVGSFSIGPYYRLIEKYNDREHRDIWEYTLNLDEVESAALVDSVWEHSNTYSDYFFFDENCSYHLLFLFDTLRPQGRTVAAFPLWAIPADTVRVVISQANLLESVQFRPAAATILRHQLRHTADETQIFVADIVEGRAPVSQAKELGTAEAAKALELASSVLTFRLQRERDQEVRSELASRAHAVLTERSSFDASSSYPAVPTPEIRPDQGHDTLRASFGVGFEESRKYSSLGMRLAYHDMLDPPGGYLPGAEISIFSLEMRAYESDDVQLERFLPLEIRSLAARQRFITPISWALAAGIERRHTEDPDGLTAGVVRLGPGIAYELGERGMWWALSKVQLEQSGDFSGGSTGLGVGLNSGLRFDPQDALRIVVEASAGRVVGVDPFDEFKLRVAASLTLDTNVAWVSELERRGELGWYENGISTSLRIYW